MQHVLPGLAERSGRRRLAAEGGGGLPFAVCFFDRRLAIGELHVAWSPELAPRHGYWRSLRGLATLKCLGIIGGPQVQREWIPQCRLKRDTDSTRTLYRRASFFKAYEGRGIANAHVGEGRDLPPGVQVCRHCRCLAVDNERPGELVGSEILRYRYGEEAPLPSR